MKKYINPLIKIVIVLLIPLVQYSLFIIFSEAILDVLSHIMTNIIGLSFALLIFFFSTFILCCLLTDFHLKKNAKTEEEKILKLKELIKFVMCVIWIIGIRFIIEYIIKQDLIIVNHSSLSDLIRWSCYIFYCTGGLLSFKLLFHLIKLIVILIKSRRIKNY